MSVCAWVVILWKGWVLRRATQDIERAVPAFWDAASLDDGRVRLRALDREQVLLPLLDAARPARAPARSRRRPAGSQLTRRLRDALHRGLAHLQFGQVLLASIGSTAPFVGLFGTVWGIYHALVGISRPALISIEKVSGPVGEALIMTAAGMAVAIPAVLAYNIFGKWGRPARPSWKASRTTCARWCWSGCQGGGGLRAEADMAFGRLERATGVAADERHQHDAADRRDAGAAGDLHHHRAADDSSLKLDLPKTAGARPSDAPQVRWRWRSTPAGQLFVGDEPGRPQRRWPARARGGAATRDRGAAARRPQRALRPRGRADRPGAGRPGLNRIGFVTEAPRRRTVRNAP
jgi:biopolymer transport protein ExbB